jgi:hypothetical protein
MERPEYIIHVTIELHSDINDVYEAMMDGDNVEAINKCKEAIKKLKDIVDDCCSDKNPDVLGLEDLPA